MKLNDNRLLALVRSGLWKTDLPIDLFNQMTETDWKIIFKQSSIQGVMGIAYDGMLPWVSTLNISRNLFLTWSANVEAMEKRYYQQCKALEDITEYYHRFSINTLVLKGIGLSTYYPNPSHREGGDIDIYLFNDFEKGNKKIAELGINVLRGGSINPKHTIFYYHNIPIENHQWFLSHDFVFKKNKHIESVITEKIDISQCKELFIRNQKIYVPSTMCNAFYLLGHMSSHIITSGLTLRHLCDWAVFLNKEYAHIDFKLLESYFLKSDFLTSIQIITSLTFEKIGLHENKPLPFQKPSAKMQEIIWNKSILQPLNQKIHLSNLSKKWLKLFERIYTCRKLTNNIFVIKYIIFFLYKRFRRMKTTFSKKHKIG